MQNAEQQVVFDLNSLALGLLATQVKWLLDNYEASKDASLPRNTLHSHYLTHCRDDNVNKLYQLNASSFGKLIKSVFPELKMRRLGTRLVFLSFPKNRIP